MARLLISLVVGLLFTLGMAQVAWVHDYPLATNGQQTYGKVTGKTCRNHGAISYTFTLDGKVFKGEGFGSTANPDCSDLAIGDPVVVTYLPNDPATSCTGNARDRLAGENAALATALLFISGVTYVALDRIARSRGGAAEEQPIRNHLSSTED